MKCIIVTQCEMHNCDFQSRKSTTNTYELSETCILEKLMKRPFQWYILCRSSFCGSPVMKTSILQCRDNLNLTLLLPPRKILMYKQENIPHHCTIVKGQHYSSNSICSIPTGYQMICPSLTLFGIQHVSTVIYEESTSSAYLEVFWYFSFKVLSLYTDFSKTVFFFTFFKSLKYSGDSYCSLFPIPEGHS